MLTDDELDFDDFGDFEGDTGEINTEELEKELELEFNSDLPLLKDEVEEGETKDEEKEDDKKKEEGESTEDDIIITHDNEKPVDNNKATKPKFNKPNNNNFNKFNGFNNMYPQQPQQQFNYIPDAFAMNPMFVPYPQPQFSNRIYVNPKFNKGMMNPQQVMQQQQRQYMEAQRMMMMQQQLQMQQYQEQQRLLELEQKRREAAEMMRKRKEEKEKQKPNETERNEDRRRSSPVREGRESSSKRDTRVGEKRDRRDDYYEEERQTKRPDVSRVSSTSGGISIKGAAARNHVRNQPYTPPHQQSREQPKDIKSRISVPNDKKPSITSRLGHASSNEKSSNLSSRLGQTNTPQRSVQTTRSTQPYPQSKPSPNANIPIATSGKSDTLVIKGLNDAVTENDIKKLAKEVPGGIKDIKIQSKVATVVFTSIESAVTFRRKFNRIRIQDASLTMQFKK